MTITEHAKSTTHNRWIMVSVFRTASGFGNEYQLHVGYDSFRPYETLIESLRRIAYNIARQSESVDDMVRTAVVKTVDGGMVEREIRFE